MARVDPDPMGRGASRLGPEMIDLLTAAVDAAGAGGHGRALCKVALIEDGEAHVYTVQAAFDLSSLRADTPDGRLREGRTVEELLRDQPPGWEQATERIAHALLEASRDPTRERLLRDLRSQDVPSTGQVYTTGHINGPAVRQVQTDEIRGWNPNRDEEGFH